MKNEGATVLEWVAYHRLIGVDHFLIYTNDCEDGTDRIWMRLEEMGLATHRANRPLRRAPGVKPQQRALIRVMQDPVYLASDWVLFLDADEFLNIHTGDGSIDAMMARNPRADCFLVSWRLFGTSNIVHYVPAPVTEQFTHACALDRVPDRFALSPKSMFRRDRFAKPGIHRPAILSDEDVPLHALPSGEEVARNWRTVTRHASYDHAQVNHYSVQSLEGIMLKFARGFALNVAMPDPATYLRSRDTNHVEDRSIQRHRSALMGEMARLLDDPVLAELHEQAVAWRRRQVRRALKHEPNRVVLENLRAALSPLPADQSAMAQPSG